VRRKPKLKTKVDPAIMAELLAHPSVAREIAGMPADVLAYYKDLLVDEGVYDQYVRERKQKDNR